MRSIYPLTYSPITQLADEKIILKLIDLLVNLFLKGDRLSIIKSFEELPIWKDARKFTNEIYNLTKKISFQRNVWFKFTNY